MFNFSNLKQNFLENKYKILKILGLVIIIFFSILYMSSYNFVNSGAGHNLSGFAWGADDNGGVGWISFNSTDGGGGVDYGVNLENNGDLIGYAWSENFGWLKFGGLSNFPSGPGTQAQNANLNGNNLKGWIRFCSVFVSGCSGALRPSSETGNWDGWVSLNGSNYGVTLAGNTFSGFAWGGGDVISWIDFSQVNNNNVPSVTIFADKPVLPVGGTFTITWFGANLNSNDCQTSVDKNYQNWPSSGWPLTKPSSGGNFVEPSSPLPVGDYNYKITCTGTNGASVSSNTIVSVIYYNESITLKNIGAVKNNLVTLEWTTEGIKPNSCLATLTPQYNELAVPSPKPNFWNNPSPKEDNGSLNNVYVPNTAPNYTTYTLTCEREFPDTDILCGFDSTKICVSIELNEKSGKQGPKWEWD